MQRFLQEIMKKKIILGTSDAWSTSHLSNLPREPAYSIEDWQSPRKIHTCHELLSKQNPHLVFYKKKEKIIPYCSLEILYLIIHTLEFLVENFLAENFSKGSDVSDCYLLLQKTFASDSCVSCYQRFANCPQNCLQNCP